MTLHKNMRKWLKARNKKSKVLLTCTWKWLRLRLLNYHKKNTKYLILIWIIKEFSGSFSPRQDRNILPLMIFWLILVLGFRALHFLFPAKTLHNHKSKEYLKDKYLNNKLRPMKDKKSKFRLRFNHLNNKSVRNHNRKFKATIRLMYRWGQGKYRARSNNKYTG